MHDSYAVAFKHDNTNSLISVRAILGKVLYAVGKHKGIYAQDLVGCNDSRLLSMTFASHANSRRKA